jgi:hypothetical protein
LLKKYINIIVDINYNVNQVPKKKSLDSVQFRFLKYQNINTGMSMHMDRINKSSGSLIVNISLGPEFIYYDIVPITIQGKNIRLKIKNGDIVFLDDISRFQYAHGLPYDMNYDKIKYTISIRFDLEDDLNSNKIYDPITKYTFKTKKNICYD